MQLKNLGNLLSWTFDSTNTADKFVESMKGLSIAQQAAILNTKNFNVAQRTALSQMLGLKMATDGQTVSTTALTAAETASTASINLNTMTKVGNTAATTAQITEETKSLLVKGGLITEEQLQAGATVQVTSAKVADAVATNVLTAAEGKQIITTLGLTGATTGLSAAMTGLSVAFATNPLLLLATAAAAAYASFKALEYALGAAQRANEAAETAAESFKSLQDEVDSLNTQIESNQDRIAELRSQGPLSFVEKDELQRLKDTTEELRLQYDIKQKELALAATESYTKNREAYEKEFGGISASDNQVNDIIGNVRENSNNAIYASKASNGISGEIANLILYKEKLDKALSEENTEWINTYEKGIESITTGLNEDLVTIQRNLTNLNNIKAFRDLTEDEQTFYNALQDSQRLIYQYTNPSTWNQMKFDSIFDTEGIEVTKEELIALSKSGELDESTIASYKNLSDAIENCNFILQDGETLFSAFLDQIKSAGKEVNNFFASPKLSYADTIAELDKMKESLSALDSAYAAFIDKDKDIGFDELSALNEKFKDVSGIEGYIRAIQDAKGNAEATQTAFDNLTTAYITQSGIIDKINDQNSDLIKSFLEEQGIAAILADAIDLVAAQKYYAANASLDLANATESEMAAFIGEAEAAGISRASIVELMMAKISCNNTGIVTDGDINNLMALANAAGIAEAAVRNAKAAQGQKNASGVVRSAGAEQALNNNIAQNLDKEIKTDLYKPKEYTYSGGNATNSARKSNSGGGGGKEKKEKEAQKKEFNWIDQALNSIARSRDKILKSIEDETNAYSDQLSELQQLLALDDQMVTTNQAAMDIYSRQWDEIRQKIIATFGEADGNAFISKIMNGDTSWEGFENIFTADKDGNNPNADLIDQAKDIYSSLTNQEDAYEDAVKQRTEDIRKEFEIRINMIKASIDEVSADMDKLQSKIDIKETAGQMITEADYERMIRLSKEQMSLYDDQIDALEEQADEVEEGSAEYYNLQSQIASCSNAISQCEKQQAKWNEEILNLPIRRIERYLELLKHIKQDMTNKIDEQNSLGITATRDQLQSLIDISVKQIEKLKEEHDELTKKLGNYEYGSDKFNETANSLQDVEDEISSLIQAQNEWNKQILQIPLDKISKLNEQLGNIRDALNGITDTYDTAIGAVVDALDDQVDAINDLKDATTKEYDAKIKPYQDELDLLKKQNEERKIQLALEQATYDLDRAQNQKTNKVNKIAYFYSNVKYASSYIG